MADSNWLTQFPAMERAELVTLRKYLDGTYREFSRTYGEAIETFFDPLMYFLVWFEKLLLLTLANRSRRVDRPSFAASRSEALAWRPRRLCIDRVFRHVGRHHADARHYHCRDAALDQYRCAARHRHGALGPGSNNCHTHPRHHADHARLCVPDPLRDAAWDRQG